MAFLLGTDYRIQSDRIYHGILSLLAFVSVLLILLEIFVDIQSNTLLEFLIYGTLTFVQLTLSRLYPKSELLRAIIPVMVFAFCEYMIILEPKGFGFMAYWFPLVATLALVIQGMRAAIIWVVILFCTHFANYYYVSSELGAVYSVDLSTDSTLWSLFVFMFATQITIFLLYNLLGEAYKKSQVKNDELILLKSKIEAMNKTLQSSNESLEKKVTERTKELKIQNEQLKKYAFSNSHVIRSPLSNIMALVELMKAGDFAIDEEVLDALKESSNELDQRVRKINLDIENEVFIKLNIDVSADRE